MATTKTKTVETLVSVRALANRTMSGREDHVAATLTRVQGLDSLAKTVRHSLIPFIGSDAKGNGGTLTFQELSDKYVLNSTGAATRFARVASIVLTHDSLNAACGALVAADGDYAAIDDDARKAMETVGALVTVIGRNGSDRPAPSADEVRTVALAPSADPVAALDALIDARLSKAPETDSDESDDSDDSGETEETGDPNERDAIMAREALARIMARDGGAIGIPASEWNAIAAQVTEITATRKRAAAAARSRKSAA